MMNDVTVSRGDCKQVNVKHDESFMLERLRAKDDEAFRQLMDLYGDGLKRMIYLLTSDHHFAEDICQETFVTVYEKIEQFTSDGTLKGWMTTIALNHCRSRMRKAAWKRLFYKDMQDEKLVSKEAGPEEVSMNQHLIDQIHQLPYKYREVIVLYYYEDLSIAQMSMRLKEKQGTIKSKLFRARHMLKRFLQEEGE